MQQPRFPVRRRSTSTSLVLFLLGLGFIVLFSWREPFGDKIAAMRDSEPRQAVGETAMKAVENKVEKPFVLPIISEAKPAVVEVDLPQPKPRPLNCGAVYKNDREVMLDHECYPPTGLFPPRSRRSIAESKPRVDIQYFETQNKWKSRFITWEDYQQWRAEPAIMKSFDNVVVYKADVSVYFKGPDVWSASYRCNPDKVTPAMHPPGNVALELDEAVLSASQIWGYGYGHMVMEKAYVLGAARAVLEGRPHVKVLVEASYSPITQMLALLGISEDRIQVVGPAVRVKRLHTTYFSACGWLSPENSQLTRKWFRDSNAHLYKEKATNIMMIDRVEGGRCNRCIQNTQEVVDLLQQHFPDRKVIRYIAGTKSIKEQMEDMSKTEVLIAPHGAGLANMIFLPDNGKVVEIQNHPSFFTPVFLEFSTGLDLCYRGISPRQLSPTTVDWNSVDPQNVLKYVKEILALG